MSEEELRQLSDTILDRIMERIAPDDLRDSVIMRRLCRGRAIDIAVQIYWGEPLDEEFAKRMGLSKEDLDRVVTP